MALMTALGLLLPLAAVHIGLQCLFQLLFPTLWGIYLRLESLDHMVILCLAF